MIDGIREINPELAANMEIWRENLLSSEFREKLRLICADAEERRDWIGSEGDEANMLCGLLHE